MFTQMSRWSYVELSNSFGSKDSSWSDPSWIVERQWNGSKKLLVTWTWLSWCKPWCSSCWSSSDVWLDFKAKWILKKDMGSFIDQCHNQLFAKEDVWFAAPTAFERTLGTSIASAEVICIFAKNVYQTWQSGWRKNDSSHGFKINMRNNVPHRAFQLLNG